MSELVTTGEGQSLIELDEAKRHIALARQMAAAEDLHEWRDRAAAMLHYSKMRGDSQEAANQAAEIKVRAEAALGALDAQARPASVGRKGAQMGSSSEPIFPELDVAKGTRANWRKLGQLEEAKLDEVIATVRELDDTISTAAVVREVKKETLARQSAEFQDKRRETESAKTPEELAVTAAVIAEIATYAPTAEFVSEHSMLAAQALDHIKDLPEVPADEKGLRLLAQAAANYELVAEAIRIFTGVKA